METAASVALSCLQSNDGWQEASKGSNFVVFTKKLAEFKHKTHLEATKIIATLPYSYEDVQEVLQDIDVRKHQPDENLKEITYIQKFENGDIVYTLVQPPVISERDSLTERRWKKSTGKEGEALYQWVICSTSHPDCPEKQSVVRMTVFMQAIEVRDDPKNPNTRCFLTMVNQSTLGGWIPEAVTSMMQVKMAEKMIEKMAPGVEFIKKKRLQSNVT